MDVSVEVTGSFYRRLKVTIPSAEIEKLVSDRLRKMTRNVRLDGFRPGRVPIKLIRERYGGQVFDEVVSEVMESSYRQAVAKHHLAPVSHPDITKINALPGRDVQFTADIELYPEFELVPLMGVKIDKFVVQVHDSDVEGMVEKLRLRYADWRAVERPVQNGDRVRVHLEGEISGLRIDDNGNALLTVGDPGAAGDIGLQLLKAKRGDTVKVKVKYSEEGSETEFFRRRQKLKVAVREVEESILPPLNRDFFDKCGIKEGGLKALKEMLREGMEYELKHKIGSDFKNKVLDMLVAKHDFEAPRALVQREIERMRSDVAKRLDVKEDEAEIKDDLFRERAAWRVKLGLIMSKIAERHQFDVSEQEFQKQLDKTVMAYEEPDTARQHYQDDPRARSMLVGLVLEDKISQWVINQVKVVEKPFNFNEIMSHESARADAE